MTKDLLVEGRRLIVGYGKVTVMPIDPAALERSWEAACDDAKIATPAKARLYYVPGGMDSFQGAFHLRPKTSAVYEYAFPFSRSQLDDANSAQHRDLHRVVIRDMPDEPTAVALLRHELEHARQYNASVEMYVFMTLATDTLATAFRNANPPDLDGSALLYNFLPQELDANRAAATCVRRVFGDAVALRHAGGREHGQLFREMKVPERDILPARLVALCAIFPGEADQVARAMGGIAAAIRTLGDPSFTSWWSGVRPAIGLAAVAQRALAAIPSAADVAASIEPKDAWRPALRLLTEGFDLAHASIAGSGS